ncbi:hypothetical protein HWQ46_00340 [Shewanella sp. D64]|uniref:hypothetical protein n=1 Tax=unclassified Shewanella TaxID=196818 RepID=UPI0022BA2A59|nr:MULTISPECIES: hypothetical protein [unclassified Shewanella]MEC4724000.1 hypothetical protein [Shewanella sp. D64]MEC4736020.1 hypothetical protein [Shewanella sp. E94]WBJ98035.1 hypothetical protein HWQ47_13520 [Shewanella sp. MTB7]WBJ98045.1 hypothetical protein HWQ47_13570 [Shewanella sp. MTB7]
MPTKHVDDATWRKVEKETVKAVVAAQSSIRETEILRLLILKGLEHIKEDDYKNYANRKKR